jgi:NADPH:quinone reductase-like Zn-dependent oxidoreductase
MKAMVLHEHGGPEVLLMETCPEPLVGEHDLLVEVYASPNLFLAGANAELVAVDARSAARRPATVDHATAAAVPLVGLTAWRALHGRARVQAGQTVLIAIEVRPAKSR